MMKFSHQALLHGFMASWLFLLMVNCPTMGAVIADTFYRQSQNRYSSPISCSTKCGMDISCFGFMVDDLKRCEFINTDDVSAKCSIFPNRSCYKKKVRRKSGFFSLFLDRVLI